MVQTESHFGRSYHCTVEPRACGLTGDTFRQRPLATLGSTALPLKLPHVLHQPLHALDRHGIVDRSAHAADRAVAFELHQAARFGAFQPEPL